MKTKATEITEKFTEEKNRTPPLRLPFRLDSGKECQLICICYGAKAEEIEDLAQWREENNVFFPAQFKVTHEGTALWLKTRVLDVPDRILFWVLDPQGERVGHVGLFRISTDGNRIELDNIVLGKKDAEKGIMFHAVSCLLRWQRETLQIPISVLRTFSNNGRALRFYEKLAYKEIQRVPVAEVQGPSGTSWEPLQDPYVPCEKYFVTMMQ